MGRPLGAQLVGPGDNGGCGERGPVVAPDGSGRPRRERAGLRRRRRQGPGRRSGREVEGAPPAGRARGRRRGAAAGAGSRGEYDDPAAEPRISSPPPPPHSSPSSRLRTRHTGGESGREGASRGGERPPSRSPRRGRADWGSGPAGVGSSGLACPGPRASPRGSVVRGDGNRVAGRAGRPGPAFGAAPGSPATSAGRAVLT